MIQQGASLNRSTKDHLWNGDSDVGGGAGGKTTHDAYPNEETLPPALVPPAISSSLSTSPCGSPVPGAARSAASTPVPSAPASVVTYSPPSKQSTVCNSPSHAPRRSTFSPSIAPKRSTFSRMYRVINT